MATFSVMPSPKVLILLLSLIIQPFESISWSKILQKYFTSFQNNLLEEFKQKGSFKPKLKSNGVFPEIFRVNSCFFLQSLLAILIL
jgi:hypothetical protein